MSLRRLHLTKISTNRVISLNGKAHTVAVDLFLSFVAIYSPLLSPGTITGLYIYIEEKLILQSYAMKGEVSPGRGFSSRA